MADSTLPLPPNFDWVTERKKCSALTVFEQLRQDVQQNLAAFHDGQERRRWNLISTHPEMFTVTGQLERFRNAAVRFMLVGDEMEIEGQNVDVKMTATLTLNDRGQCRLLVDGKELDRWQVLRRALEPLLFPPERR